MLLAPSSHLASPAAILGCGIEDFFSHRSDGSGQPVVAGLEIACDIRLAPPAQSLIGVSGDIRCKPALQVEAAKVIAGLVASEQGFRGMAARAMSGALHQISAAIPGRGLVAVGLEFSLGEVQRVPGPHRRPNIEWKRQRVGIDRLMYGLDRW